MRSSPPRVTRDAGAQVRERAEHFPKSIAPTVKSDLRDIWQAETRAAAETAIGTFTDKYGIKYGNAVACLVAVSFALATACRYCCSICATGWFA